MDKDQMGLSQPERNLVKKQTRRERFLSEMETVLPWPALLRRLKPLYPARGFQGGSPAYPLEMMLRIHLMQHWWSLSDEAMEDAMIEIPPIRRFAGINSVTENIPDAAAILAFRRFLDKRHLRGKIFKIVEKHLRAQDLLLQQGAVVEATIVDAPTSTKHP